MTTAAETEAAPGNVGRGRRRIGVGVIGFGWLGQAHSRSLMRIPTVFPEREFDAELVVCADPVQKRIDDAVRSFGFARGTATWQEVMDDPAVDVVVIAAPNMLHVDRPRHGASHGADQMGQQAPRITVALAAANPRPVPPARGQRLLQRQRLPAARGRSL